MNFIVPTEYALASFSIIWLLNFSPFLHVVGLQKNKWDFFVFVVLATLTATVGAATAIQSK